MNIEKGKKARGFVLLLPLVTALPVISAMSFLTFRHGRTLYKLVNIVIKMAVTA